MIKTRLLSLVALMALSSCQSAPATATAPEDPWKVTDVMYYRVMPWEDPDTKCQYLLLRTGNALAMVPRVHKGKHYCGEEEQDK